MPHLMRDRDEFTIAGDDTTSPLPVGAPGRGLGRHKSRGPGNVGVMGSSGVEDVELLRRIAGCDDEAFSSFYRAHLPSVVAFFNKRVGDRELAFDLAAETFAAVVVAARNYEPMGPPTAWLFGIARNKLRESLRRSRVEQSARLRLGMEPITLEDADLARIGELADSGEGTLSRALQELPDFTRDALLARVVEEQEYGEIAARLQCSQQVARQRVHRGLTRLRAEMKEDS
jgi:RNA polymerase sigma factor (sigma-70 family)